MEHESTQPSGFLLIDKPPGPTSHDVIDELRRRTGIRKIGHAGTLDPFASGLLLVAVGRDATREIHRFVGLDKMYEATFVLGVHSTTLDPEGDLEKLRADLRDALRTHQRCGKRRSVRHQQNARDHAQIAEVRQGVAAIVLPYTRCFIFGQGGWAGNARD